ncbi:hypothetical protein A3203_09615 [Burkholderia cenocepacia]|nr:hypothetical protein A3203_09615 [Burkholderia cenocepacia]
MPILSSLVAKPFIKTDATSGRRISVSEAVEKCSRQLGCQTMKGNILDVRQDDLPRFMEAL